MISHHELKRLFNYNPLTGEFTRLVTTGPRGMVGEVAGTISSKGYRAIQIHGKIYKSHILAWFYVNGVKPRKQIDHINRDRLDNRISNLREVNNRQNCSNRKVSRSGYVGVTFSKYTKKWRARIKFGYREHFLGYFHDAQEASKVYEKYARYFDNLIFKCEV